MTTMELIERGIGHNCLSDAYELGRADAIDECIQAIEDTKSLFDNSTKWTMGEKDKIQNRLRQLKEQNGKC